jgi:hypothetical protein
MQLNFLKFVIINTDTYAAMQDFSPAHRGVYVKTAWPWSPFFLCRLVFFFFFFFFFFFLDGTRLPLTGGLRAGCLVRVHDSSPGIVLCLIHDMHY